jgi:hypothetical protein
LSSRNSFIRFISGTLGIRKLTITANLLLVTAIATALPEDRGFAGEYSDESGRQKIVNLCHTSQGNGFNWAASLGWLSESFAWQAQSNSVESLGKVTFDVQCMAGSSSAAGTTVLLSALLENPRLGWSMSPPNPRRFSGSDLMIASRALRLIALTADFGLDEQIGFAARYALPEDSSTRNWWPSRYGTDLIRHTLGRRILFASLLEKEDLEITIPDEDVFSGDTSTVTDILEFDDTAAVPHPGTDRYDRASRFLAAQRRTAIQLYNRRLGINRWSWNERADRYLRTTPVSYGFLTTAFALVQPLAADGSVQPESLPPAFTRLRKLVIANRATIESIINSPAYRRSVQEESDDILNFVFVEVTNKGALLQLSQAEPENEKRLVGPGAVLGIQSVYDPRADQDGSFELRSADNIGFIIAGGWTNPETTAWPLVHLQLANAAAAASQGKETIATFQRFGKQGRTASFPNKVLKTYFYRNEDGTSPENPEANLQRYLDAYYFDSDNFVAQFDSVFAAAEIPFTTEKVTFNWDISSRPAAAANQSQVLSLGVAKAFREHLAQQTGQRLPYVFVPAASPVSK